MRELQLWADEEVLDTTFSEISDLAAQCRFSDCSHEREPGCAIRRALNDGTLARDRWDSYCKLQRELRALAIRKDARLALGGAQGAGEVREKPEEDRLLSRQRGVQVDLERRRVPEQGIALAPERVPGLLLAFEPCFRYSRVDLVDLGRALALEGERDLVARRSRFQSGRKLRMTSSLSSMRRTPFGRTASTWPSSGVSGMSSPRAGRSGSTRPCPRR